MVLRRSLAIGSMVAVGFARVSSNLTGVVEFLGFGSPTAITKTTKTSLFLESGRVTNKRSSSTKQLIVVAYRNVNVLAQ